MRAVHAGGAHECAPYGVARGAFGAPPLILGGGMGGLSRPTGADWATVIGLSVIWGASFMNVKMALTGFGPLTIGAGRIVLATLVLVALARWMGLRLPGFGNATERQIWAHVAGMAFFSNALPFFLLGWGQRHVASGFAGITMAAVPLFTMVLAQWFVPGERMTAAKVAGFGLGIAGVVVLIGPAALIAKGGAVEEVARLSCVAAALSYSIGSVVTRRCPPMHMVAFSAAALLCAGFMAVPMALLVEGVPDLAAAPVRAGLAVVYLGLLPTALATVLMVRVINGAGPVFLTLSNYQVPVWSVIFGVLVLGERLPGQFLAALGLILAGLAVTQAGGWMRWSR